MSQPKKFVAEFLEAAENLKRLYDVTQPNSVERKTIGIYLLEQKINARRRVMESLKKAGYPKTKKQLGIEP